MSYACNFAKMGITLVSFLSLFAGTKSQAAPIIDLAPLSLSFTKALTDDVSNSYAQRVGIKVKNVGNTIWRFSGASMVVKISGTTYLANVYGPQGSGYVLNGSIKPREQGLVMFYLRLGTLQHCRTVTVQIDANRTSQTGFNVFANDTKTLVPIDTASIRGCAGPIIGRNPLIGNLVDEEDEALDRE